MAIVDAKNNKIYIFIFKIEFIALNESKSGIQLLNSLYKRVKTEESNDFMFELDGKRYILN